MKYIPFSTIKAAQEYDGEAIDFILRHFENYIVSKCLNTFTDKLGDSQPFIDDDLYYQAKNALLSATFSFRFREPPVDFVI